MILVESGAESQAECEKFFKAEHRFRSSHELTCDMHESCLIERQTTIHLRLLDLTLVRHWPQLFSEYQGCEGGVRGCWWVLGLSETY